MNKQLEAKLRAKVRKLVESVLKEGRSVKFEGVLDFKDNPNITDRYLERNYWGDIGGDSADISDFMIYDDGTFSGYLNDNTKGKKTKDDYSNMIYDIILNHDSNTYKFIDTIGNIKISEGRIKEEGPMPTPADFKPTVKATRPANFGNVSVTIGGNGVRFDDKGNNDQIVMVKKDAIKLAQYLFRVLGKV